MPLQFNSFDVKRPPRERLARHPSRLGGRSTRVDRYAATDIWCIRLVRLQRPPVVKPEKNRHYDRSLASGHLPDAPYRTWPPIMDHLIRFALELLDSLTLGSL